MDIPIDLFENWLRSKNLKERTIKDYIYYFNKFIYPAFNQETVSRFLSEKSNRNGVSRGFLVNFKKFLASNYKELGFFGRIREEILEVEIPKVTGRKSIRLITPISPEHIPLLEKVLPTEKLKIQLLLSYYCGLRLGELMKLTIISFNWMEWKKDKSKMGECRVYGKGDKEGIALVPPFLMKRIADYIKNGNFKSPKDYLFIKSKHFKSFDNVGRIWQMELRKAGIKSGLTQLDPEGKPIPSTVVHPHRLRHSYASHLFNSGMDIKEIQELLRHSSIQSTQIYVHINKEKLKEKLSNLKENKPLLEEKRVNTQDFKEVSSESLNSSELPSSEELSSNSS